MSSFSSFKNFCNFFFFFLFASSSSLPALTFGNSSPAIGVTISQAHLPDPQRLVPSVRSLGITHVRLPNPTPTIIRSFSFSGVSLLVNIPNPFVPHFAANRSRAVHWLFTHVVPFYPRVPITVVSVGNDLLSDSLLPAIRNVHLALHELRLRNISVSTSLSFRIIKNPFPPSAARFQEPVSEMILRPLLEFLTAANSSFLINANPYDIYVERPDIPIGFVVFQEQPFEFRDDPVTGLRYRNLFDVMIDALVTAMEGLGYRGVPVVVTETGWPSRGYGNETDATLEYAEMHNVGLVRHLRSGLGTPLRREGVAEAYIFELLDESLKQGGSSDGRHWGILNMNMTKKYPIRFSGSSRARGGGCGADLRVVMACFWSLVVFLLLQY